VGDEFSRELVQLLGQVRSHKMHRAHGNERDRREYQTVFDDTLRARSSAVEAANTAGQGGWIDSP
jgi:hypothetical protein